jgi:hypothetical protein
MPTVEGFTPTPYLPQMGGAHASNNACRNRRSEWNYC